MSRVITVFVILIAIISVNGLFNFILLNNADALSQPPHITVIDNSTKVKSGNDLAGGEGGGKAPFSLYPLNYKDVKNFYAVYKPDNFPDELRPTV